MAWRREPVTQSLFEKAGVEWTFVLHDERKRRLYRQDDDWRFSLASTFKIANSLIDLSHGVLASVDLLIPYLGEPNPFMREWLEAMCMRGPIRVVALHPGISSSRTSSPHGQMHRRS